MRRALLATLSLLLLVPATAAAQCPEELYAACHGADVIERDAQALTGASHDVEGHEGSWVHRALAFQSALGDAAPLRDAPWVGTHNSFNSIAEMGPALSTTDSNQQLTLVDQLRLDVRSLELDVHWWLGRPTVCHADGSHAGCSAERDLGSVLAPVGAWLRQRPGEVLLLYLEDHLDGNGPAADAVVREQLGDLVYEPPAAGCTELPLSLSRADVRAAGRQVLIVSGGCGLATAFDWSAAHVETRPVGFQAFPSCGPDFTRAQYDAKLVRYYEDSTWLTAGASQAGAASRDEGITPATAAAMARCGVDLVGLDQLLPDDGRLEALVWSWAEGEQEAAGCAAQRADGRWARRACAERLPAACRTAEGWTLTRAVRPTDAARTCTRAGGTFAPPRTGFENALLRAVAGDRAVWLSA
jgi:hypothetical protein